MRLTSSLVTLLLLCIPPLVSAFTPADTSGTDRLARTALHNVRIRQAALATASTCTLETASVRKEWDSLCADEKRAFIAALLCLQSRPAISGHLAPGARSRYDDFLATHINQTTSIHGTGNFLMWHRYFIFTFERALREECAYDGVLPYFNYARYAFDLLNAPIFDGSDTSLSGNGAPDPTYNGTFIPNAQLPQIYIPPSGHGGGCLTTGPFANTTTTLGPVTPALPHLAPNPRPDGLGPNPRCLRRDLSPAVAARWTHDGALTALVTRSPHIGAFQTTLQGDFAAAFLGVHTAAHFLVGGDPGGDLFASAGDVYFYVHHAQIDRLWWIWQNTGPDGEDRYAVVANTTTVNNLPPSRNATLDDWMDLGVNGWPIRLRDAVDTLAGPFCYVYL